MAKLKTKSDCKIRGHHPSNAVWLDDVEERKVNETAFDTAIDLWENTNDILEQLLNSPDSLACRTLAINCIRLNKELFKGEWKSDGKE